VNHPARCKNGYGKKVIIIKKSYKYGIELETIMPRGSWEKVKPVMESISWNYHSDPSINAGGQGSGIELVSPPIAHSTATRDLSKLYG